MVINNCPETASETYLRKNLVYAYFKVKKFQKKISKFPMHSSIHIQNFSLKFDSIAYSVNYAKP